MIKLLPIADAARKNSLASLCECELHSLNSLCYGIFSVDEPIGLCEFSLGEDGGRIHLLRTAPGVNDPQALILALRAALFFMDNAGVTDAFYFDDDDTAPRAVGFHDRKLHLTGFFDRKCEGSQG